MCHHAEFGRSALKGVGINTGLQQSEIAELRCLGMGCMADLETHAPPHVLPHQIWYFCNKGCTQVNRKELPKLGSARTPPPSDRGATDP